MKHLLKNPTRIVMIFLVATIALGGTTSCKSKKKLAAEKEAAAFAARVEKAKKDLNAIINGTTDWSLDKQRARVEEIKGYNINDDEIDRLIGLAEKEIEFQQAEQDRKAEEERLRQEEEARRKAAQSKYESIDNEFRAIAQSSTIDAANQQISLSLDQFASPDVPVLIIISQTGNLKDYDRPTTAEKFLNYLKDVKGYKFTVESVKYDNTGKITEIELLKK
jgi:TolA-binding protein